MLEIICVSSLALSVNANSCPKLLDSIPINQIEISQVISADINSNHIFLAKGKPYKSRYREEADRYQEEADRYQEEADRYQEEADRYQEDHERDHRQVDGVEVRDGRIYRDADHYRRQSDDRSRDRRYYRDTNYQHQEYESERDRDSRYYRQERYRDGYIRRNSY